MLMMLTQSNPSLLEQLFGDSATLRKELARLEKAKELLVSMGVIPSVEYGDLEKVARAISASHK